MTSAFFNGYSAALQSLGLAKYASGWREGANRMIGGAALGGVSGALGGLSDNSGEMTMGEVGRLSGVGALGGLGLGAAAHAFKSSDPAPMPVRAGIGGVLGSGITAGIPYLMGVRNPESLKRLALLGAGGGAGIGMFASMLNPHNPNKIAPIEEIDDTRDLAVEDPSAMPEEWWRK